MQNQLTLNIAWGMAQRLVLRIVFLSIVLMSWGCEDNNCPTCPGWDWDDGGKIHGSGNLLTQERELSSFHSIKHTTVGQVNLTYGDTQQVFVTTDDNIHTYVKTNVVNGELIISIQSPDGLSDFDLSFDITIPEIKTLTTSSAGVIDGKK